MSKDLYQEFQNAEVHEYINLFSFYREKSNQIHAKLTSLLMIKFKKELRVDNYQDEKQSKFSEFNRFKAEAEIYSRKIIKKRGLQHSDQELELAHSQTKEKMQKWQERFDRVQQSLKLAFQEVKSIINNLTESSLNFQLEFQEKDINFRVSQLKPNDQRRNAALEANDYYQRYKMILQSLKPNIDEIKDQAFRNLTASFDQNFNSIQQLKNLQILDQNQATKIQQIENQSSQLKKIIKQMASQDNDRIDSQQIYDNIKKIGLIQQKIKEREAQLDGQVKNSLRLQILKVDNKNYSKLISDMIMIPNPKNFKNEYQEKEEENSKIIIRPIKQTNRYLLVDVTKSKIDKTEFKTQFEFLQGMGFVSLSHSLVLAGGQKKNRVTNKVYQLQQSHRWSNLLPMKYSRCYFPLLQLMNGKHLIAICGISQKNQQLDKCQILKQFKKWSDLPNTNKPLRYVSACSVGKNKVYILARFPSGQFIEYLNLKQQEKKWQKVNVACKFLNRRLDSCCYLKEQNKIINFGSTDGDLTSICVLNKDKEIKLTYQQDILPFTYYSHYLHVWKIYDGHLHCLGSNMDKLWIFDGEKWVGIEQMEKSKWL